MSPDVPRCSQMRTLVPPPCNLHTAGALHRPRNEGNRGGCPSPRNGNRYSDGNLALRAGGWASRRQRQRAALRSLTYKESAPTSSKLLSDPGASQQRKRRSGECIWPQASLND